MTARIRRGSHVRGNRHSRLRAPMRVLCGVAGAAVLFLGYLTLTLPDVRPLASAPPTTTAFMQLRAREAHSEGRPAYQSYQWVEYARIAPTLKRAVLVAEDSGFRAHEGIELEAMRDSFQANLAAGTARRGGSTITQQLAKNLYLSPSRNPVRKVRELMVTRLLERLLSKRRILELYLNVVEWGDGTWGAEAASQRYFRKSASSVGAAEAALLAGALINPVRYSLADPPPRLRHRQRIILRRMGMRDAPVPPAEHEVAAPPTSLPPVRPAPSGETPTAPPSSDGQVWSRAPPAAQRDSGRA